MLKIKFKTAIGLKKSKQLLDFYMYFLIIHIPDKNLGISFVC